MTISNSSLDYEIPFTFQYPVRQQTLTRRIYTVGKKILTFFQKNQFAIAMSLSSFLITKTIAAHVENSSAASIAQTTLKDCQDKICAYWNNTLQRSEENSIVTADNNSLSRIEFRCNTSHPHYKPFQSIHRCLKDWCKYAEVSIKNSKECLNPTKKIVHLWNKFCPKSHFDQLKNSQKINFLGQCLKNLCDHYKARNQTSNFYSFCVPLELHGSMEKLYKLVKNWKKAALKTKAGSEGAESVLSITSSSIGIISAGVSIVASAIGCYVAKSTISSVSSTLPKVSMGLRSIVDGTLAYARRASALPPDLLSVPSGNPSIHGRVSQISSQVDSLYYDAASAVSVENPGDVREFNFNFGSQEEETLLMSNVDPELVAPELIEEKNFLYDEILPEGANFAPDLAEKVIETIRIVTQKAITPFTSTNEPGIYEEVIDTIEKPINEFMEFKKNTEEWVFPNTTNFLHNVTAKVIQLLQIVTQKVLYEETISTPSPKDFIYTTNITPLTPSPYNTTVLSPLDIFRLRARMMNMG